MQERTIELEVPLLLPGVDGDEDACLERLTTALNSRRGIIRAHMKREFQPVQLCLHYNPALVSIDDVRRMADRAGAAITDRYLHEMIYIEDMDCSDCALVLEHSLARMHGVLAVRVNYAAQTMFIEYDARATNRRSIERRVAQLGYNIPEEGVRNWFRENRELLFGISSGLFLLLGWLTERLLSLPLAANMALYAMAYILGGYDPLRHGLHKLRERQFDTDMLMVVAALGSAALGQFAEGALLLFLFSLGHALEERTLNRARKAIRSLGAMAPKTAIIRRGTEEVIAPVDSLEIGEIVIVRAGERIPVDGEVLAGRSLVNQAPVTGESLPVEAKPQSMVFAGSLNGEGALEIRVSKLARDSTLARVQQLVERAQAQKSPTQRWTERITRIFVPSVLSAAGLVLIGLPLLGVPLADAFARSMTLLVAASPCALALGTPSAILAGVAQAARNGVLLKGGMHLENLGKLKAIAFDKTGTLTRGEPHVTDLISLAPWNQDQVLKVAAALESRSTHPLGQAVVREAKSKELRLPAVNRVSIRAGLGVEATIEGALVFVGGRNLIAEREVIVPPEVTSQTRVLEKQGKTVLFVVREGVTIGLIALADGVRPDARSALADLRALGLGEQVILTGDNETVAAAVAQELDISEYRSRLMPQAKLEAIDELIAKHGVVAMVGDGVNDAPALAAATVGIAMGGAGTDVALESADVALMADDLSKLPFAISLGRATRRIIRQNLYTSLAVIAVLITLALSGLAGIGLAILLHEGSTVLVVLNSLRLLNHRGV
jgi:Cd2+/Zn2+-exporting ATPase